MPVFTSGYYFCCPDGRYTWNAQYYPAQRSLFLENLLAGSYCEIVKLVDVFLESVLTHTGVGCVSKKLFYKVNFFNENLICAEDHHMWLRLANEMNMIVYIPSSALNYSQRNGGLSKSVNIFPRCTHSKMYYLFYKDSYFKIHRKNSLS